MNTINTFRGTTIAIPMKVSNSGTDFENARKHGVDGTIPQATGLSEASAWLGDSHYESERMHAGRKNGMFRPEFIGAKKKLDFGRGHIFEKAVAECNALIMSIETGFDIEVVDASKEEWRCKDAGWDSVCAHLDFWLKITKGKAIPNPNFVIGGPEPNYKIVPDAEDHWYIADSKTVRSCFGYNWKESDEKGIPVGGMKNGIAPTAYRQQMLGYMGICHKDGAFLLAHKGGYGEDDFARVFIPYDKGDAESILDEIERLNTSSYNGQIPSVRDCKDVALAISELPLQFPDVNRDKKMLELESSKWKASFDRIFQIDAENSDLDSTVKTYIAEMKQKLLNEKGISLGSVSIQDITRNITDDNGDIVDRISTKKLKDEKTSIMMMALEEVQDRPSAFYEDENGDAWVIEFKDDAKWTAPLKEAVAKDYPEVFDDLRHRFPDRSPKLVKAKISADELRRK